MRSSKQDQIHASIVCTLLALMDGLDNRGDIIVIGKLIIITYSVLVLLLFDLGI